MKVAVNEKEHINGIAEGINMTGVVNTSFIVDEEVFKHDSVGYILRKAYHYENGEKKYSLPFYFTTVDVTSKEDPAYRPSYHSFAIRKEIFDYLQERSVPYINIFETGFRMYFWSSLGNAISTGINLKLKETDGSPKDAEKFAYVLIPYEDMDIVFDSSSIKPSYFVEEKNIDVSMIPKRSYEYNGRPIRVKE